MQNIRGRQNSAAAWGWWPGLNCDHRTDGLDLLDTGGAGVSNNHTGGGRGTNLQIRMLLDGGLENVRKSEHHEPDNAPGDQRLKDAGLSAKCGKSRNSHRDDCNPV